MAVFSSKQALQLFHIKVLGATAVSIFLQLLSTSDKSSDTTSAAYRILLSSISEYQLFAASVGICPKFYVPITNEIKH